MNPIQLIDVAIGSVLALIMFGVGLSLSFHDFSRIVRFPKAFFSSLGIQMLGLPIIAFAIHLSMSRLPAEVKVGFIILAASPGGATSGFLAYLWRANVALSLSITAVNSFLTLFTIPFITNLGLKVFLGRSTDVHLPIWETMGHIFAIAVLPAVSGILVKQKFPTFAARVSGPARYVMLTLLAVVFLIKILGGKSQGGSGLNWHDFVSIAPYALLQNLFCLFAGYFFLRLMQTDHPSRLTAAIESGVQNTTLSFLIAGSLLQNEEMVKAPLIYSLFSFWTACLFGYFSNMIYHKQAEKRGKTG